MFLLLISQEFNRYLFIHVLFWSLDSWIIIAYIIITWVEAAIITSILIWLNGQGWDDFWRPVNFIQNATIEGCSFKLVGEDKAILEGKIVEKIDGLIVNRGIVGSAKSDDQFINKGGASLITINTSY